MNLFRRTTASVALVALVSGIFSTGVSAYDASELMAANALAAKGFINTQNDAAGYNLDATITRGEMAKVAANIAGVEANTSCENKFADVTATTPNNWVCGYAEALLAKGLVSANANFNPNANISKSESVKLMLTAAGENVSFTNATWQADFVAHAVENGFVTSFSDYNTSADRGFVFGTASAATTEEEGDIISDLEDLLGGDDEDDTTTTPTTPTMDGDDVLEATVASTTPDGMDVTQDAKGVNVLEFDVTAGSEDVSISSMQLERTGFGSDAADEVAIFSEEGRVSKNKSFNSDDEANVTFSPALVIKAGETMTLTARVNLTSTGEFAVRVTEINATSTVEFDSLESNTFDAKSTLAAKLEVKNEGVNTTVTSGETQADVAEFNLKNKGAATSADVDVTVTSITLKEIGSIDHEDFLENLTLSIGGDELATVSSMNGKYVTFEFDGVTIDDGKNETFKVTADITGGAGDEIQFELDSVVDIEANASRYNSVNVLMDSSLTTANGAFDSINVEAGELTIYAIDAEKDKIRGDKDDVILGQLKIVNVAGKNLELDNLKVTVDMTGATTASVDTIAEILENVEFEVNGTSYDLNISGNSTVINGDAEFSETDLDIILPQGTSILTIRADSLKDLDDGTTLTMSLVNAGTANGGLVVVETEDDENVDDISPSSLSWDALEVENASVTVSNVPLADVKVVKGASDLVALQFEVEAGEASSVTLDEVKVLVNASGSAATKDEISEVALYRGSVSDANVLDRVSGSKLASGVATFDGFEIEVAADATETFIVTVNTVDTTTVVGKVIVASLDISTLGLDDDENDEITGLTGTISDKMITVQDSGSLVITADANNDDNEDVKTILAGEETVVYSADVLATNEEVNVETVAFTLNTNLKTIVKSAKLYLDDALVATATNSDVIDTAGVVSNFAAVNVAIAAITAATDDTNTAAINVAIAAVPTADSSNAAAVIAAIAAIPAATDDTNTVAINNEIAAVPTAVDSTTGSSVVTFDNISNLDIATSSEELRLALVTETIGFEKIGSSATNVLVTKVTMDDAKGVDSNEDVTVADLSSTSAVAFAVVPVKVTASVVNTLADGTAQIRLTANAGGNTQAGGNTAPEVTLNSLDFTSNGNADSYKVYEDGESAPALFAAIATAGSSASVTSITFTDSVIVNILAEGVKDFTYALDLDKDGVTYNTSLKSNMTSTLPVGSKTY